MLRVCINQDDPNGLEKALRKFKKISFQVEEEVKKHEFYLRPGLKKAQKSKLAQWRDTQFSRRKNKNGTTKNNKRTISWI